MRKIEHLGIAVKDLKKSKELFEKLLGKKAYKEESVESEGVSTSFFKVGETKIELLQANNSESAISKFIDKRSEGVHHIAFEVDDIYKEIKRLKEEGFEVLNEEPKRGADHKLVVFLHPRSTNGVLVELCQDENPLSK
ncbi:methylmalonyl-CoA epimerase [Echinicola salinicaeni]|uniref:methylmalonyl-CoA epimerase n=1 Tax=Echinicola salinicaeni TaxID=2762757 RepID=UPI001645A77A|nr:methylmalonyl-CoA epimerase [Echinicola salinicaeni]